MPVSQRLKEMLKANAARTRHIAILIEELRAEIKVLRREERHVASIIERMGKGK